MMDARELDRLRVMGRAAFDLIEALTVIAVRYELTSEEAIRTTHLAAEAMSRAGSPVRDVVISIIGATGKNHE